MKKSKIWKIHILHTVHTYLETQSQTSMIVVQYGQDSNLDEWLNRRMVHKLGLSKDSSSQTIMSDAPEEVIVARSITNQLFDDDIIQESRNQKPGPEVINIFHAQLS